MDVLSEELKVKLTKYNYTIPQGGNKVYKDECIYCFDGQESNNGLNICLSTLFGVSQKFLPLFVKKEGKTVFLNFKKVPKEVSVEEPPVEKRPTKMAIGVEGGFDVEKDKVEYECVNTLIVTDNEGKITNELTLPNPDLPLNLQCCIAGVIAHQGASMQENVQAWEEKRIVSKYALNLQQLDNGVKIPPSGWKCALCDLTQNLWLNLTDGTILCGRKFWDGSGGNNHAVEYYEQTKYPLAVKLGTITAEGGDVYSYDEDDMVEDPKLKEHLLHFGINIALLEKTDKTMTELEVEANLSLKAEWDTIQEAGKKLKPLNGPGYTGMINLGNSCYMNSIMQILFSMTEFQHKYANCSDQIFQNEKGDPTSSFNVQTTKLGAGLLSGDYSQKQTNEQGEEDDETQGVRPQMFKSLIGRGHVEFSTNHQQDAQEFFLHFMDKMEKEERNEDVKLKKLFMFQLEDRVQCTSSQQVAYKKREEMLISLPIPLDKATNIGEFKAFEERKKQAETNKERIPTDEIVRLKIPMTECLNEFTAVESVEQFYSTAIKSKTTALKRTRFATFPDYLVIQLRRFTVGDDWVPKKLDVSVEMEEMIDLNSLRGNGLQSNETQLPDDDGGEEETTVEINEGFVAQLMDMGFPLEACKKAVHYTNNQGVEAAMNWVFEHSQDADFASPLQLGGGGKKKKTETFTPNIESVSMLMAMGFTDQQAHKALKKTNNNLEAAAEWMFSNPDELNTPMEVDEPATESSQTEITMHDGNGKYKLMGFASHMGTSTSCGHYVCHIYKEGRWVIYNDRKVAESETPPRDLGYIYFYKRI